MYGILIIVMIISAIIFIWSVLLMSPKWWLWMGIWGMWQSWEYGSKKSLEWKLKYIAIITSVVFIVSVLFLPYFLPSVGA